MSQSSAVLFPLHRLMVALAAVWAAALMPGLAHAQVGADLNISPKRVVLSPGERSATVYIFNQGDTPATYTVELVDRAMLADGEIALLSDHPGLSVATASGLLQYTPRRVVLAPRESQSIRIRATSAPGGEAVEYRTHLTVTAVPEETTGLTAEAAAGGAQGELSFQVTALFSVSIPIILRTGEPDARAGIEGLHILPGETAEATPLLGLELTRLGANSVYGDLEVRLDDRVIGLLRGVAVYPEVERRSVVVPLTERLGPGAALTVIYRDDDAEPGRELATASLAAP